MTDQPKRLKSSFCLTHKLLRAQVTPLLVLFVITTLLSITLEDAMVSLSKTQETERWMIQLGMGLWDLIDGILLILILSWGIPKVRELTEAHFEKHPFQEGYLGSFLAEYFRVLAKVLLFGLLLILPGFFKYCRLIFVPYLTLFAKPYREGKIDALELSQSLTEGRFWWIVGVLILSIALQTGIEFAPQLAEVLHILPLRIVFNALNFYFSVWIFALFYLEFERAMDQYDWSANGSHV